MLKEQTRLANQINTRDSLPNASKEAIAVLSTTKCYGKYIGAFRDLTINLVLVDGSTAPSFEVSAAQTTVRALIPAQNRVPFNLEDGLKFIVEHCVPEKEKPMSQGGKVYSIQDRNVMPGPKHSLTKFDPKDGTEKIESLSKLKLAYIAAKAPSIIDLGEDKDGVKSVLLPARLIYDNSLEYPAFILRKTFNIGGIDYFDESRLKMDQALELILNTFQVK